MPYYYIYYEFFTYIIGHSDVIWGITQLLFLWIADLREIYAKLFTNVRDRTYQNADANGCNASEAQRTKADNI
jgi:hypothetical protein